MMQRSFFNCYWVASQPTLGHYRGDSLTHRILITDGPFETEPTKPHMIILKY